MFAVFLYIQQPKNKKRKGKEQKAMCNVYDEGVYIEIMRNTNAMTIHFWELQEGDMITSAPHKGLIVAEDAHKSGDACYEGWLFLGADGDSYFPEDFGAALVNSYDESGNPDEGIGNDKTVFIVLAMDSEGKPYTDPIAVYRKEDEAAERVRKLQAKDKLVVNAFSCDPTNYSYKEYAVL